MTSLAGARTPTRRRALSFERAEGARLYTVDGHTLIDLAAGVLVANLGHAHPEFERLLTQYRADQPRTAYNLVTPILAEASQRLVKSLGMPNAQKLLLAKSRSIAPPSKPIPDKSGISTAPFVPPLIAPET